MSGVTVIITAHRRVGSLRRALESVLKQSHAVEAIIISQDGNDPNVCAVIDSFSSPLVNHIRIEGTNSGPAITRNAGLASVETEWTAFLDDDDEWLPDRMSRLQVHRHSADVYCANAFVKSSQELLITHQKDGALSLGDVANANPIVTSTVIARTVALRAAGGFRPSHTGIEDFDLWLTLLESGYRIWFESSPAITYSDDGNDRLSLQRSRISRQRARRVTALMISSRRPELVWLAARATASAALWSLRDMR